jgi:hypothetical protein
MTDLTLCASCERHFRPGDAECPFCGAVASSSSAPIARAPKGLSRARLYALHTAALATGVAMAVACGGDTTTGGDASTDGSSNDATSDTTSSDVTATDATNDVALDQSSGDASTDVVEDDGWGPPPPPYGCVFPGGCASVTV